MGTKRDDFKVSTINTLRERVYSRCSNPNCRVPTTGPKTDDIKVNNIGTAAHITAAASGGARYDESLSYSERRSINNGIWLCTNCSRDIDNDPKKYSVELLKEWKKRAEDSARNELGKRLPEDNYVVQSLASALTGQSNILLPKLVSNACDATSQALESLDPRFSVKTKFTKGINHYEIFPKQRVDTKLTVSPSFRKEFYEKYTNLIEHGEKLSIDSKAINFKGSPLLEELHKNTKGKLEFSPVLDKDAVVKIWLISPDGESKYSFNDLSGMASLGRKSITINCDGLKGHLVMAIRLSYSEDFTPISALFNININFNGWDKNNLSQLPYFDKLYEFHSNINQGWQLNFSLEIEGLHITSGHSSDTKLQESFIQDFSHLNFIFMVREIAKILKVPVFYDDTFEYTSEFNLQLKEVYEIISTGLTISGKKIKENARCTLEALKDLSNIIHIKEMEGQMTQIRIDQLNSESISPFNHEIILPKFSHILTEVYPIINCNISNVSPGDLVEIEWKPSENCQYKIEEINAQQII